jgi:hypothetical protein
MECQVTGPTKYFAPHNVCMSQFRPSSLVWLQASRVGGSRCRLVRLAASNEEVSARAEQGRLTFGRSDDVEDSATG